MMATCSALPILCVLQVMFCTILHPIKSNSGSVTMIAFPLGTECWNVSSCIFTRICIFVAIQDLLIPWVGTRKYWMFIFANIKFLHYISVSVPRQSSRKSNIWRTGKAYFLILALALCSPTRPIFLQVSREKLIIRMTLTGDYRKRNPRGITWIFY